MSKNKKYIKFFLVNLFFYVKMVLVVVESGVKWNQMVESGEFSMYMGEYNHTIDAKGRIIVPSKFRDSLGDSFVITKGMDGCLYVYDNDEWTIFEEKLSELPMTSRDARNFLRFFLAGAMNAEVDKQGRVLIPQTLRDHAQIEKDVVFLGVGKRIEIWSKESWEGTETVDMDEVATKLEELGLRI